MDLARSGPSEVAQTGSLEASLDYSELDSERMFHPTCGQIQQFGQQTNLPGRHADVGNAVLWLGSANNYINLHPASGFLSSGGLGIGGDQQVGSGTDPTGKEIYALLWYGSAESVVNLHPAGYILSHAEATDGFQQVGSGFIPESRALLWHGSAESVVDLTPVGAYQALAHGVAKGQQVGAVQTSSGYVGALWYGSAESFVDMTPPGHSGSYLNDTNGVQQVGVSGWAAVWTGTPESWYSLHALLPAEWNATQSVASAIDEAGNVAGWFRDQNSQFRAVAWLKTYESLLPRAFSVERGILVSGNVRSLTATDGDRLVVRPGLVLSSFEAPVSIIVETISPVQEPLYAQVVVTSSSSVSNINGAVEAYNYFLDEWIALDNRQMPTADQTKTYQLDNPSEYIGQKGEMRTRLRARQSGPVISFPWTARFDEVSWRFAEN